MPLEIDDEAVRTLLEGLCRDLEMFVPPTKITERFRELLRCVVCEEFLKFGGHGLEVFVDAAPGASEGIVCARFSRAFQRDLAFAAKNRLGFVSH